MCLYVKNKNVYVSSNHLECNAEQQFYWRETTNSEKPSNYHRSALKNHRLIKNLFYNATSKQ